MLEEDRSSCQSRGLVDQAFTPLQRKHIVLGNWPYVYVKTPTLSPAAILHVLLSFSPACGLAARDIPSSYRRNLRNTTIRSKADKASNSAFTSYITKERKGSKWCRVHHACIASGRQSMGQAPMPRKTALGKVKAPDNRYMKKIKLGYAKTESSARMSNTWRNSK